MTGATSPLDLGLWTKVPKYEDVVKDIEKDYKVRLPERTALTFWDSFALSQYRDMVAGLEGAQEGARAHQGMEAAMEEAVGQEEGVTRREMLAFMTQLQAQSSSAAQTLQQNLDQSAQAHRRALQEQGDQFARSLAEESQRADRRERAAQQAAQALREAPQTAPSLAPPSSPAQQVVNNYHTTHNQQIVARDVAQEARRDGELAQLREGQGTVGRAIAELIQRMEGEGASVRQMVGALANQPRVLQQIANVDARSAQLVSLVHNQYIDQRRAAQVFQQFNGRGGGGGGGGGGPGPPGRRPLALRDIERDPDPPEQSGSKRARRSPAPLAIADGPRPPQPPPPGAGGSASSIVPSASPAPEEFFIGDPSVTSAKKRRIVEALAKNAAALAKKLKAAREAREAGLRRSQPQLAVRRPGTLKRQPKGGGGSLPNRLRMAQDLLALEP